jgi:acyl-CoA thioester hydrolase
MGDKNSFKADIHIRWRDLDTIGHVNHSDYFTYFEDARATFLDTHGLDFNDPEVFFILVHVSCDYLKPVAYKCKIAIHIRCLEIGEKSFKFAYAVADRNDESVVYAKGESVQVCLNPKTGKSAQVSKKFKKVLGKYLV